MFDHAETMAREDRVSRCQNLEKHLIQTLRHVLSGAGHNEPGFGGDVRFNGELSHMKLSVVIPTYNYGRFLHHCLESVAGQMADDTEIIVVDDGSTDDTSHRLQSLSGLLPAGRLRHFYQQNAGPAAARNHGVRQARGDFIWFLDADDCLNEGALDCMRQAIMAHPQADLIFAGYRSVGEKGRIVEHSAGSLAVNRTRNLKNYLLQRLPGLTIGSAVIRKAVLQGIVFPEGVHSNEDVVFFGHLLATCRAVSVPGQVVDKVRHPNSLRNDLARIEESGLQAVERLFDPEFLDVQQMRLRSLYLGCYCMNLFRTYYLQGYTAKARGFYRQALGAYPLLIFNWGYASKFLRSLFGIHKRGLKLKNIQR